MSDLNGISSLDVLTTVLVNEVVLHNQRERATVDAVEQSPNGVVVYVDGDANPRSPPRKLTGTMFEHGYAYADWVANGTTGDERAMYEFRPVTESDGVAVADEVAVASQ